MDNTNYEYYAIDTSDIWIYECGHFEEGTFSHEWMDELYYSLHKYFVQNGQVPFIEANDNSPYAEGYRNRFREGTAEDPRLNFFVFGGNVYSMQVPCEVRLSEKNRFDFQKLFILKLRQYSRATIYIPDFLAYQLKTNFKDLWHLRDFFELAVKQYPRVLEPKIIQVVEDCWVKYSNELQGKSSEMVEVNSQIAEQKEEAGIPEGYSIIEGHFSEEEVRAYFSFLYKEKSKEGITLLKEEEVTEMFKYGLAIPPQGPERTYKLNCSSRVPKGILEYGIYKFVEFHTDGRGKREVLRFFASYISDFEKDLKDEKAFESWSRNVRNKRPARMKFTLTNYLPPRFR